MKNCKFILLNLVSFNSIVVSSRPLFKCRRLTPSPLNFNEGVNGYFHFNARWRLLQHAKREKQRRYALQVALSQSGGSDVPRSEKTNQKENKISGSSNAMSTGSFSSFTGGNPLLCSAYSVAGKRRYMEDEYFLSEDGRFAAVFDGHGGAAVSRYLRQNLYANVQAALPTTASISIMPGVFERNPQLENISNHMQSSPGANSSYFQYAEEFLITSALRVAFEKVNNEVQRISHWSFQGSTALAVIVHENSVNGTCSIITANVGDSRAVLSRNRTSLDLSTDHKPSHSSEKQRIEALGGSVEWCGEVDDFGRPVDNMGVYRINGNLALSRSIGDRSEHPWITAEVDIGEYLVEEDDSFILLATDGLFDVMSSQEVVTYVHNLFDKTPPGLRLRRRKDIAKAIVEEALARGTIDNITVLVIWIKCNN